MPAKPRGPAARACRAAIPTAFVLLAVFALRSHAAEIAGVRLPQTAQVGAQALVFNGAGVRSVAFFRVYAAALYLSPSETDRV